MARGVRDRRSEANAKPAMNPPMPSAAGSAGDGADSVAAAIMAGGAPPAGARSVTGAKPQFLRLTAVPAASLVSLLTWQPPPATAVFEPMSAMARRQATPNMRTRSRGMEAPPRGTFLAPTTSAARFGSLRAGCAACRESPGSRPGTHLAVRESDLPAKQRDRGPTGDVAAFIRVVVAGRVHLARVDRSPPGGIEDHQIRVGADGDGALARGQTGDARGRGREHLDHAFEGDAAAAHALRVEHRQHRLEVRDAGRYAIER